ncbi:MAG: peptidylprolyl isomerase [Deltaproteobacteria bacterium]|nr:peptidylprolyl isomerase [Deltaproteobacteria bacterium]
MRRSTLTVVFFLLLAAPSRAEVVDYVAIVVDSDIILMSEVVEKAEQFSLQWQTLYQEDLVQQEAINMAASGLIDDMLFKQLARKMHVSVASNEVDNALMNQVKSQGITLEKFEDYLDEQGLDIEVYKNDVIKNQLLRYKVLGLKVGGPKVTEAMAKDYYQEQVAQVRSAAPFEIADILIATPEDAGIIELAESRKLAEEIAEKAREPGADFGELAAQYSDDEETAEDEGYVGEFESGDLPEVIEKALIKLDVGEVSDPVRTSTGYHVILLIDRKASKVKSFKEASDAIFNELVEEEMMRQEQILLKELRRTTHIEIK